MTIVRREHNGNFTIVPNAIHEDRRLSIEAKGALGYLLSRPSKWEVRHGHLRKLWGIGRDKFQRVMGELIAAGYVERDSNQPRDNNNRFTAYDYVVRDIPRTAALPEASCAGFPLRGSRWRKPDNGNNNKSTNNEFNNSLPHPSHADLPQEVDDGLSEFGRAARNAGCSFVWEGTEPFTAWLAFRGEDGLPQVVVEIVDGVRRRGVWLPALYPPKMHAREEATG